jgi:hypothetical protein
MGRLAKEGLYEKNEEINLNRLLNWGEEISEKIFIYCNYIFGCY